MGGEFIPQLTEGDLIVAAIRPPSASLDEGIADATRLERALLKALPAEIRSVVSRIGRPEIGVEAAGVNMTDHWVLLNEQGRWKNVNSRAALRARVGEICRRELPGTYTSFSQPIELRFNEMLAGLYTDVGLGLRGGDLGILKEKANALAAVLSSIRGASEVRAQELDGLPVLRVQIDRERIDRHGINAADVLDVVTALGGKIVGEVVEGQRRFALQVRFAPEYRDDIETIRQLKIADPQGRMIPLEDLADLVLDDGVFEIWRKDRERLAVVQANVRGRDLAGFVAEAKQRVAAEVRLPRGYSLEWVGTFANLELAAGRLAIVVPLALGLIFLTLYASLPLDPPGGLDLPVGAAVRDRRRPGALASGPELQCSGEHRLHHPLGRSCARQPGVRGRNPADGRPWDRALRSRLRGVAGPVPRGLHDRAGHQSWVPSHGHRARPGSRSSAPAGHGRHRRPVDGHASETPCPAHNLSLVRSRPADRNPW